MYFQEGLAKKIWYKSPPKPLQKAIDAKDPDEFFLAWSNYLAQYKLPEAYIDALASSEPPLLWGLPEESVGLVTVDLVRQLENLAVGATGTRSAHKTVAWVEAVRVWLKKIEANRAGFSLAEAYETLAWAHALPALASLFAESVDGGGKLWWTLFETIFSIADDAKTIVESDSPLLSMLLAAELGLTLAYLFGELEPCRGLIRPARTSLNEGMAELLDGEGLIEAKRFELMRPLLACWIRCNAIGDDLCDGKLFKKDNAGQLEWAVRQMMRWTRSDGSQTLNDTTSGRWCKPFFTAALAFDEDDEDQDIATMTLPDWGKKVQIETLRKYALADSASHSEWSRAAVLRPDWEQSGPRFSILYPETAGEAEGDSQSVTGGGFFAELENHRQVLFSGEWQYRVQLGGKTLEPVSDWEEICWMTDDDIDYIELQQELSDDFRIQRQVALARNDRFLFFADVITGPGSDEPGAKLHYIASLPLMADVVLTEDKESSEIRLASPRSKKFKSGKTSKSPPKPVATILPIGLPEWKAAPGNGHLRHAADGRLELTMTGTDAGLCVPLFIDLDFKRMTKPLTWRPLTVAESLEVVPPDCAVGYRVQAGDEQWLIYRSLALPENRTVLGENLSAETLIAQFDETGQTEPLIVIQ